MPSKRSSHQRYILETHESSRQELAPQYVNEKYFSRYNYVTTYGPESGQWTVYLSYKLLLYFLL